MIVWVCDACGHSVKKQPIAGNEDAWHDAGFFSFGVVVDGVQDLCAACREATRKAMAEDREITIRRALKMIEPKARAGFWKWLFPRS